MSSLIKTFFKRRLSSTSEDKQHDPEHAARLATAALMLEVAEADYQQQPEEKAMLVDLVKHSFGLNPSDADELIELATKEYEASTDNFEFTRLINDNFSEQQKIELVENLWRMAFADHVLDKYEEHIIRRIADLIYVSHKDFIATKLRVQKQL